LALPGLSLCGFLLACSQANSDPPIDEVEDLAKPTVDAARASSDSVLVINEVFPHGSDVKTDPDYIELYNRGTGQISLRGYKVRDDGSTWSTLPEDAVIAAGGMYLINCDDDAKSGLEGAHVPFKLGGSGDQAHIASPDGTELDSVTWGSGAVEVPKGQSLGRVPDAKGPFQVLKKPSRGESNR
jgi:hypothetical protein